MSAVVASSLFFGGHLLFMAALAATAWVLGRRLTRRLSLADGIESFAVSTSLGLGFLSWLLFVLGLAGGFYRATVLLLAVAIHLWGIRGVAPSPLGGEGRGEISGRWLPGGRWRPLPLGERVGVRVLGVSWWRWCSSPC
ncbi:MAG: hypothetical protein V3T72_23325, partial [Thermoanaerobaculia bacterium]